MVKLVRAGISQREVARRFNVSLHAAQRWVARAVGLFAVAVVSEQACQRKIVAGPSCILPNHPALAGPFS